MTNPHTTAFISTMTAQAEQGYTDAPPQCKRLTSRLNSEKIQKYGIIRTFRTKNMTITNIIRTIQFILWLAITGQAVASGGGYNRNEYRFNPQYIQIGKNMKQLIWQETLVAHCLDLKI